MCKIALSMYNISMARMREEVIYFLETDEPNPFFHIKMTGISWCDRSYRIRRIASSVYAVEYIIEGSGSLSINGNRYNPRKGDTYILHKGTDHTYRSSAEEPWVKIWVAFQGTLVDSLIAEYGLQETYLVPACDVENELQGIFAAAKRQTPEEQRQRESALLIHNLLHRIYTNIRYRTHTSFDAVDKAISYMRMNVNQMVTLDAIAKRAEKSKSQLIRLFRDKMDQTPYEYFLDLKIDRAKLLLRDSQHSLQQIASDLGFSDAFHLSKTFKARVGRSPSEYRKLTAKKSGG